MKRRSRSPNIIAVIATAVLIVGIIVAAFYTASPSQQAKRVVDQFYSLEQEGRYSSSWELFHPLISCRVGSAAVITYKTVPMYS